ncbi:MAG TPA: TlpA disulfide reductase family protein [Methylomirabilota bacterium]|nr:TlpA disulfide reductase family protein [Methylomirabilota bacterium]
MRGWHAGAAGGAGRAQQGLRAALAIVLLAVLVWALPTRKAGEEGGHHGGHETGHVRLDPFERAGLIELKDRHRTPPLALPTLGGGTATLAEHRDKLVVVNFWATWCTPCTLEMPTLEALWREYRARGLVVLGVSVDRGAPRPLLDPYVGKLGLTFPILLDADMSASQAWRVASLPATFVVRPGGEAVALAFGAREWNSAEMRAVLEPLLPK